MPECREGSHPAPAGGKGPGAAVLPREADFGGGSPGWSLGQQGYTFLNQINRSSAF